MQIIKTLLISGLLMATSATAGVMSVDYSIEYNDAVYDNTLSFMYDPTMDNQVSNISDTFYDTFASNYDCNIYCRISSQFHGYGIVDGDYTSNRQHFYHITRDGVQVHDQLNYFLHDLFTPLGHDAASSDNPLNVNMTFDIDWLSQLETGNHDRMFYDMDIYAFNDNGSRYHEHVRAELLDFNVRTDIAKVPEPSAIWLFGIGAMGLFVRRAF